MSQGFAEFLLASASLAVFTDALMPGVWRDVVLDELTPSFT